MYLFLPGNNVNNKEWCEILRDTYPDDEKLMLYYSHWDDEGSIDWNTELDRIMTLDIPNDPIIIAKSAGCVLGLMAQKLEYLKVKAFVFIGFPYHWASNRGDDIDYLLDNLTTRSLFIQKEKDPVVGYEELNTILKSKDLKMTAIKYERVDEANDNHRYKDINYIVSEASKFINS